MAPRFDLIGDIEAGCAAALAEFLAANTGGVDLFINSPGGDAMEGAALMAEVERHGRVTGTANRDSHKIRTECSRHVPRGTAA